VYLGHTRVPLMLMSYVGALKGWLYRPVFKIFGISIWTIRVPALLAATATIWLFFLLLRRVAGDRAALLGCALLAADSIYLLTACFDWGPVALAHLLLISALLLLLEFQRKPRSTSLAAASFLLGLALWDKAIAEWMISGIAIALMVFYCRPILSLVTPRRLALAAGAFLIGALPLIVYNARTHGATFTGNFRPETVAVSAKLSLLARIARGEGLIGYMCFPDRQKPMPHVPHGVIERVSADLSNLTGHPQQHLLLYAFLLAILLAPLAGKPARRAIFCAVVALALAWGQMAITANAGGSAHHIVLLWPLPQFVIAVSLAAASRRLGRAALPAFAGVTLTLLVSGALLLNEHYATIIRNGGAPAWTAAIYKLSDYLNTVPPRPIYCLDWGFIENLRLLNRGALDLRVGTDPGFATRMIADPGAIFLAHTPAFSFFHDNEKILRLAEASGYRRIVDASISDEWGRPVYEVYRFVPGSPTHAVR
jgi:4-amino-4-deoxy-L-arabinose transferase-like glycosyltransferase